MPDPNGADDAVYVIAEIRYTMDFGSGEPAEVSVIDPARGFYRSADSAIDAVRGLNRANTDAFEDYRSRAILAGLPVERAGRWYADRGLSSYTTLRLQPED